MEDFNKEELNKNIDKFLPYLEDLLRRLYKGIVLFVICFIGGFFLAGKVVKNLLGFITIDGVTIAATSPFNFVGIAMDIGLFLAIMATIPYIIFSFYGFLVPALTRSEKIRLMKTIPISILLFIAGFLYGFFILYSALEILAYINLGLGIANFWNISQFLSQIFITSALLGLLFQFPLLLTLLIKLGIVTAETLKNKRRIAYFSLLCASALLPPTDGISLIAISIPLMVLYEVTIWFNVTNNNKQQYVRIRR